MLDIAPGKTPLQRARGRAEARFGCRDGRTVLAGLHQSGCAKAMLPRVPGPPEVVFLNTAGGLTGGDVLDYGLDVAAGAQVTATTQTAERGYASTGETARVRCRISVGAGGALDWLPQETILFDGAALDRVTEVDLAGDARLLLCETLVLGRAAMGETVRSLRLSDRREIRRDGRPVLVDAVRMGDEALARRDGPALLGKARAVALVALVAPGAEDAVGPVRGMLAGNDIQAEASGWDGRCVVRLAAPDLWPLRRALIDVVTHFRGAVPPRVWQI
ncbi:urease accessory protein UreD [Tropicimonas isoalkanivorans]|uniref:Urease accessory protein UreD n=1 Tax=Tropicimonas isoalkanivorans TaxID=441112 RepID=A0A1I1G6Z2_9RHOB|nr:urease accessory protein UreD [Tropicimonas isoalkanivorans]SFC04960.1 urease accessory protein [Tropicimonas isoalkanivorans]